MAGKLTALKVKTVNKSGLHNDGGGLYLQIRRPAGRSWVFRYRRFGKTHDMGLGPADLVTLAEARELANAARRLVRQGGDPIEARRADRAKAAAEGGLNTFREAAEAYVTAHEASWRSAKHRQQWVNTVSTYAYPVMGDLPVASIGVGEITRALQPIWTKIPETAGRVRGRIETVLDYAKANGWRTGENPARWRGHLDHLLPARGKVQKVEHHPAVRWQQIGACMAALAKGDGIAAAVLRFIALTAARSGEARGARWSEIDLSAKIWTVPGARMKAGTSHAVPLSPAALDILDAMKQLAGGGADLVFPGGRPGKPLSDVALAKALRVAGFGTFTTHGFRSTFRDWCAEQTNFPREVAEAALAHTLKDRTEAAYRRSDLLGKRRALMTAWGRFCTKPATTAPVVVPIRGSIAS